MFPARGIDVNADEGGEVAELFPEIQSPYGLAVYAALAKAAGLTNQQLETIRKGNAFRIPVDYPEVPVVVCNCSCKKSAWFVGKVE